MKRTGFTLIEVMMATTILMVGLLGLIQAVHIGTESLDTARKQQVAVQLMAAEIEQLRAGAWTTIANLPSSATLSISENATASGDLLQFALSNRTVTAVDDHAALLSQARGFSCSLAATRLRPVGATAANVTFVKVVYTVTWTSNTGRTYRRTQSAYLGRHGLHLSYQQS